MDKITLYTTHCPKCVMLEKLLKNNDLEFEIVDDVEQVLDIADKNGIMSAPILVVNNNVMTYNTATEWIKEAKEIEK